MTLASRAEFAPHHVMMHAAMPPHPLWSQAGGPCLQLQQSVLTLHGVLLSAPAAAPYA